MKYKIYKIKSPQIFSRSEPDGYHYNRQTQEHVLEELQIDSWEFDNRFNTMGEAEEKLNELIEDGRYNDELHYESFTILPVMEITYKGKIL